MLPTVNARITVSCQVLVCLRVLTQGRLLLPTVWAVCTLLLLVPLHGQATHRGTSHANKPYRVSSMPCRCPFTAEVLWATSQTALGIQILFGGCAPKGMTLCQFFVRVTVYICGCREISGKRIFHTLALKDKD